MQKINFQNLPNTTTPVSATNLNQLQTNVENGINGVIDSGSNANGYYVKYQDGTLICSIIVPKTEFLQTTSTYTAVQGTNWYRSNAPSITFPYNFIDTNYTMTITPVVSTGGSRIIIPRIHVKYLNKATIQLMSVDDFTSSATGYTNLGEVDIQIIGRWQ